MIIGSYRLISQMDLSKFAWGEIRRFHNSEYVTGLLMELHNVPKKHEKNVRKQAEQIRYCLTQAKEYFDAACSVSLATKPVLFYYSAMSLALAEILLKNDGMSSLDIARGQHRHHGLEFRLGKSKFELKDDLIESSSKLNAFPLIKPSGERFGTFSLWKKSARDMPLLSKVTTIHRSQRSQSTSNSLFFLPRDKEMEEIPSSGISLYDCIVSMPGLVDHIGSIGVGTTLVRGRLEATIEAANDDVVKHSLVIHPAESQYIQKMKEKTEVDAKEMNRIQYDELPSGFILRWQDSKTFGPVPMSLPNGTMWKKDEVRFAPNQEMLNEFGIIYVSLFICGMFARYYPDIWIRDISNNGSLSLVVEKILDIVQERMPLLGLSELKREYQIPEE